MEIKDVKIQGLSKDQYNLKIKPILSNLKLNIVKESYKKE